VVPRILRRERHPDAETLGDVQQEALDALHSDGVAIVPFARLFGDAAMWEELTQDVRAFVSQTERELPSLTEEDRAALYTKPFLVRRFSRKDADEHVSLPPSNAWVRLGVSTEILGILNAYRECPVWLQDLDLWYTVPTTSAGERTFSQQWHRDGREDHILKVFTYFSEVDGEAGPFEYIRASAGGRKYGALFPWEKQEVYPPQDELAGAVDEADFLTLTGSAGTIVICDTSGFHRGGFARSKSRILSYHTYLSDHMSRRKRKFDVEWPSGELDLPAVSRAALS
jgi:hypothetical protein